MSIVLLYFVGLMTVSESSRYNTKSSFRMIFCLLYLCKFNEFILMSDMLFFGVLICMFVLLFLLLFVSLCIVDMLRVSYKLETCFACSFVVRRVDMFCMSMVSVVWMLLKDDIVIWIFYVFIEIFCMRCGSMVVMGNKLVVVSYTSDGKFVWVFKIFRLYINFCFVFNVVIVFFVLVIVLFVSVIVLLFVFVCVSSFWSWVVAVFVRCVFFFVLYSLKVCVFCVICLINVFLIKIGVF